jgi:AGZA family xanthine/uracil permease-like MFS transporter
MGLYARRPFLMASGMGPNTFVTFTLVAGAGLTWPQAFDPVAVEGITITILVLTNFRTTIVNAVLDSLKAGIPAAIGAFILYIRLVEGGIVQGNLVYARDQTVPPVMLGNLFTWNTGWGRHYFARGDKALQQAGQGNYTLSCT